MGSASNFGETFISSLHRVFLFFVVSFFLRSLYIVLLDLAPPFALIFSGARAAAAGRVSPPPPKGAGRGSVVGLLRVLAPLVGHDEVKLSLIHI